MITFIAAGISGGYAGEKIHVERRVEIMSDESKVPQCLNCGATSDQNVLISCLRQGEQEWVCVSCLPILIHGGH